MTSDMHPACSVVVENLRQNKTDQEMVVIKKELIYLQFPGGRVCLRRKSMASEPMGSLCSVQKQRQRRRNSGLTFYYDVPWKEYARQETNRLKPGHLGRLLSFGVVFHCLEASFGMITTYGY